MTTSPPAPPKLRSPPLSWLAWAAGLMVVAFSWVIRRGRRTEKVLTRSEEKQRRKALVRKHHQRK